MKIVPIAAPTQVAANIANRVVKMRTQPERSFESVEAAPIIKPINAPEAGLVASTEEVPAAATPQPLSPQHQALAQKERALRKQQLDLQAEREAFKADQAKYVSRDALKADAMKVLSEAGVSYEQLLQQQLEAPGNPDPIQAKIEALEAKLTSYDTQQAERASSDYQQALKVIEGDVNMLVDSDPSFETIKAKNASGEVVRLIEKVFEKEGVILDVEAAAKLVEEKLTEQTLKEVRQLSQLKKIQAGLQPPVTAPAQPQAGAKPVRTLTNAMGVTRQLSARERAILAFNNQLK